MSEQEYRDQDAEAASELTRTCKESGGPDFVLSNTSHSATDSLIGEMVGKIRIEKILGAGGMGQVYAGFDEKLKRPVALKSIRRRHAHNREMKARFLQEAQILSRLQHPNICQIYDYIEDPADDENGSDYLVLELIDGETLKDLDPDRLTYEDKLSVAVELAEVLAAAHDAGVVHRDLKPANVMLTSDGQAKMLDFGIAQSIIDEEVTRFWQPLTTEPSTAPSSESAADPSAMEIAETVVLDTVKEAPVKEATAKEATVKEATVKEAGEVTEAAKEPEPTRILGESTVPADFRFRTQTGSVVGTPQSMSPEQARGERAGSASDMYSFGLLLQGLFTGKPSYSPTLSMLQLLDAVQNGRTEPVVGLEPELSTLIERLSAAAPGSRPSAPDAAERLRWIQKAPIRKRRRTLRYLGIAALCLIALTMSFQAFRIQQEATRAQAETIRAEREAETTREVLQFFLSLFKASNPWEGRKGQESGQDITVGEVLDRGLERLENDLKENPMIRAQVLDSVATAQLSLGRVDRAQPLLEESLTLRNQLKEDSSKEPSSEIVETLNLLAIMSKHQGDFQSAEMHLRKALDHYQALDSQQSRPDSDLARVALTHLELGSLYAEQGRFEEADPALHRALSAYESQSDPSKEQIALVLMELATVQEQLGDFPAAEEILLRTLRTVESHWGEQSPWTGQVYNRLGIVLDQQDKVDEAIDVFTKSLDIVTKSLGNEHTLPATIGMNLGSAYRRAFRYEEADERYRESRLLLEDRLDPNHPRLGELFGNWGNLQLAIGDYEAARGSIRRAKEIFRTTFGEPHPAVTMCVGILSEIDQRQRHFPEAEEGLRQTIASQIELFGDDYPGVFRSRSRLARVLAEQNRLDEARRVLASLPLIVDPSSAKTFLDTGALLAQSDLERRSGNFEAARSWIDRARPLLTPENQAEALHEAVLLRMEGNLERDSGRPERALEIYEASRKRARSVLALEHPRWIELLEEEAFALLSLGRQGEADAKLARASELMQRFEIGPRPIIDPRR